MKKEPIPIRRPQRRSNLLPQPPSLAKQPSLQPDPKCHLRTPRATALRSQALSTHLATSLPASGKVPPAHGEAGGPRGLPHWRRSPTGAAHSLPSVRHEARICVLFCYRSIPGCVSLDCNINIVQLQTP